MTRLRVDFLAVARSFVAVVTSVSFFTAPVWGASSLGTIVYAERAAVGTARASVGATVYSGDRLSTDSLGSLQIRTGAARLLLSGASSATFAQDGTVPVATLSMGSATFSTANSKAFVLHVASAVIRPATDQPTIGVVNVLNAREFVIKSTRGSLTLAVEDDVREVPEGAAYHVLLDPTPAEMSAQGPRGAGTKGIGGPPIKAARSKFIWYAIALTVGVTWFALHEVFESPERP